MANNTPGAGSTPPLRVGIIGCGRILPAHLEGLRRLKERGAAEFVITALCARREEDAAMFRRRGEGPPPRKPVLAANDPLATPHLYVSDFQPDPLPELFTDYRELLAGDVADAFIVTTSLETHHEIGIQALERGKHVLMEKPLAITVRAAREMLAAAQRGGAVLATAENARYREDVRAARWAVETGRLGELQMVLGGGIGAGVWSPHYVIAETPWRHEKRRAGGGPVVDLGVHRFDVLRHICGPIESVSGLVRTFEPQRILRDLAGQEHGRFPVDVEDTAFAQLAFASGAIGQYVFSWGGHGVPFNFPSGRLIWGSRGSLAGQQLTLDDGTTEDVVERFRAEAPDLHARYFPHGLVDDPYGMALEQLDFFRAIAARGQTEVNGAEGLRDLAVAYAVIESSLAGRPVTVEEVERGEVATYQEEIDRHFGLI
ncbi:MAG TPA: Gfo/Idh/MocA family oxidoreductase [Chloroflexota bacterium]|nr:Gfo/Idh/MocA family oxidoreductase [Chloroflexota bacterium]